MVTWRTKGRGRGHKHIRIHRKGFTRKGGIHVKGADFTIVDRGARGRGPKVIPPLGKGKLGIVFRDGMTENEMKRILAKQVKREGERTVAARLRALQVLNKRTNPDISRKAAKMADWVYGSFINKRKVPYPTGFR